MENWAFQFAEHWKKRRDIVHAFGLVLYTDRHANIKKVLLDNDYWAALDEISGPKWPIFSIRPRQGNYDLEDTPPGYLGMMVPVWKEPKENLPLLEVFGLQTTEDLPKFIVFCTGEGNEVLHQEITLKDNSKDEAYLSLKIAVEVATEAIEGILPENYQNTEGIYAALNLRISSHNKWVFIKKAFSLFQKIKDLKP